MEAVPPRINAMSVRLCPWAHLAAASHSTSWAGLEEGAPELCSPFRRCLLLSRLVRLLLRCFVPFAARTRYSFNLSLEKASVPAAARSTAAAAMAISATTSYCDVNVTSYLWFELCASKVRVHPKAARTDKRERRATPSKSNYSVFFIVYK
jgi:hypothetical protein